MHQQTWIQAHNYSSSIYHSPALPFLGWQKPSHCSCPFWNSHRTWPVRYGQRRQKDLEPLDSTQLFRLLASCLEKQTAPDWSFKNHIQLLSHSNLLSKPSAHWSTRNPSKNSHLNWTAIILKHFSMIPLSQQWLLICLEKIQKYPWKTCWILCHLLLTHLLDIHAQKLASNDRLFFLKSCSVFAQDFVAPNQKCRPFHCCQMRPQNDSGLTSQDPSPQSHAQWGLPRDQALFPLVKIHALCSQRRTH